MPISVIQIKSEEMEPWAKRRHYAKRVPNISYAFGLYIHKELSGVISYGSPPTPQIKNGAFSDPAIPIIELNRLCLDTPLKNAASILVGRSLKLLPGPSAIISYADSAQGHVGYIYQATNFLYTGAVTAHDSEYLVNGKKVHPRTLAAQGISNPVGWARENNIEQVKPLPKHRYVYFVGTRRERQYMRECLIYPILPYPKGDVRRYDASGDVPIQGILF